MAESGPIAQTTNPTLHDPHGPDDPFRTINYHHGTHQDMMEWMGIRILVGEMAGADEDFGSEIGQMWLNFGPSPNHNSNSA